jgi:putative oxidoreductase
MASGGASMINRLVQQVTSRLKWLPPLVARITIGEVFIGSGWGKLHHLDKIVAFFTELGIPAPQIQAPFASAMELICGVLVLLGVFTEIASVPLIIIMIVALITAKKSDIGSFDDLTSQIEYLYIVILIYLGINGAGPIAFDRLFKKSKARK